MDETLGSQSALCYSTNQPKEQAPRVKKIACFIPIKQLDITVEPLGNLVIWGVDMILRGFKHWTWGMLASDLPQGLRTFIILGGTCPKKLRKRNLHSPER